MSCPLRVDLAGGLYHVTSRGDGLDDSYHFESDRVYWLDVSRRVRLYDSAAGRGRCCVARPDPWLRIIRAVRSLVERGKCRVHYIGCSGIAIHCRSFFEGDEMKKLLLAVVIGLVSLTTGCASIVTGQNQSLSVETRQKGKQVVGANCKLSNNKGIWYVITPGSTTVQRSYEDLAVRCEKDGIDPGIANVKSSTKAMAFGNIIFGGIIGAGVDMASGSAYDYPSLITVEMGETSLIAPPPKAEATQQSQASKN